VRYWGAILPSIELAPFLEEEKEEEKKKFRQTMTTRMRSLSSYFRKIREKKLHSKEIINLYVRTVRARVCKHKILYTERWKKRLESK